jgi:5-methyltetrahydropteroyltriglutamate--homocysteine methyltransferase
MRTSTDRILTTHVGSLPRPQALVDAAQGAGPDGGVGNRSTHSPTAGDAALDAELHRDVEEIVREQIAAGLDVVNDGEFGKVGWSNYILERISGFEIRRDQLKPLDWLGRDRDRFPGFFAESDMPAALKGGVTEACVAPIEYVDRAPLERDLRNLADAAAANKIADSGKEVFFTTVAPASTAFQGVNEFYKTEEEYIYAIAEACREEYLATVATPGVILQVDDAVFANMYDFLIQQGDDVWKRWAQLRIDALNHALRDIPEDRVRYHICFGSWHVPHVADAPLSAIVPFMLQVHAQAYSIEAANPRHEHEWTVWEDVKFPEDRVLIPGIVTHHTVTVEHPDLVAQRIERFANILGPERVIAGTDCGFAQASTIARVHPEVMWAKFGSLVEGAEIASRKLY